MTFTVDVVVPVYGNWAMTDSCLQSLAAQTTEHQVIVVDDKSPDDTVSRLRSEYPHVKVVELPVNSGFAAACNRGLSVSTADVVVLVNNDVQADAELLHHLIQPFADPGVGSSTPLLTQPNGEVDAFGITADVTLAGFLRMHGAQPSAVSDEKATLLGPYGAVAAYRRAALDEVGLLDERIFMYGEELDLALRLSAAGWSPAAAPLARGVHLGGATSGRGTSTQRRRAGFGRGYLLRAYGVLHGRHAIRAIVTELIVCVGDLVLSRDLASLGGRVSGWRAGARAGYRNRTIPDLNRRISFIDSLRLRIDSRS